MTDCANHIDCAFCWTGLLCLVIALGASVLVRADEPVPLCFDTDDRGEPGDACPAIEPWRVVTLDPEYGGLWVVAGDVNGDGEAEIVSAENVNEGDVHYTSAAVAQKLDGTVVWRWGDPGIGRKKWHHDVACQIHDWDGDGNNEVVLCTKGSLVALDGRDGHERRRFPIPEEATDCLVFCDLSGRGRPEEVLVKTRYGQVWAYNRDGNLLWTAKNPGGHRTAHQPVPMDLDGDGRDEVMSGYAMLNPDGSVRWVYESKAVDSRRGHLDCVRVVRRGATPSEFRLALTCCGANNLALIDGEGAVLWEVSGHHFESVDVGKVMPGREGMQIVVDIDHRPEGEGPLWVLDESGAFLGRVMTRYARHHALLDWTGDGCDEIVVACRGGLYDHQGKRIAAFGAPEPASIEIFEKSVLTGDMTGDGVPDVMITTPEAVYIYRNERALTAGDVRRLGTEPNFTLY